MKRIRAETLRRVVEYLEDIGLEVIGPVYDHKTHTVGPPCSCFNADKILVYRKDFHAGKLIEVNEA